MRRACGPNSSQDALRIHAQSVPPGVKREKQKGGGHVYYVAFFRPANAPRSDVAQVYRPRVRRGQPRFRKKSSPSCPRSLQRPDLDARDPSRCTARCNEVKRSRDRQLRQVVASLQSLHATTFWGRCNDATIAEGIATIWLPRGRRTDSIRFSGKGGCLRVPETIFPKHEPLKDLRQSDSFPQVSRETHRPDQWSCRRRPAPLRIKDIAGGLSPLPSYSQRSPSPES
jgi:hypothetical protein